MDKLFRSIERALPSLASSSTSEGQLPPHSPHTTLQAIAGQTSNIMNSIFSKASSIKQWADDEPVQEGVAMRRPSRSSGGGASDARDEAQRLNRFNIELKASCINIHSLKRLAIGGIPPDLRITVYKLLLGYLPAAPEDWAKELARRRTQYVIFTDELMLDSKRLQQEGSSDEDHPLSLEATSQWKIFFQDSEIMQQVERDVQRTHPDLDFFVGTSDSAVRHREELKRALFLYAKLNPGLRYIQGMNELIAPLYYLFSNDPDKGASAFAEADAFWCFMDLISDFRDHFCQQLDGTETGIKATIRRFMLVLRYHDEELWRHIEITNKVDAQFFAFRWITLLLAQEFKLDDVYRIWDVILSDSHGRMDCLLRVCCAMVLNIRPQLMTGDFTTIMRTLQRYPPVDITIILNKAQSLEPCKDIIC
jgi:hypothetical protein